MAELRLFKIMSGPLLAALMVVGLLLYFNSIVDEYSLSNINSTELEKFEQTAQSFQSVSEGFENESNPEVSSGDEDASFFAQGLGALQTVRNSYDLFGDLIDSALQNLPISDGFNNTLKIVLLALVTIVITLGIIAVVVTRMRV